MYISRVFVRNFRNLSAADVTLSPGLNCLVGPNGTGKSNLVDAIRLCLDRDYTSRRRLEENDFFNQSGPPFATHILISIEFTDVKSIEERAFLNGAMILSKPGVARITYRFRPGKRARDQIRDGNLDENTLNISHYEYQFAGGDDKDPADVQWDEEYGNVFSPSDLQHFQLVAIQALRDASRDLRNQRLSPLQRLVDQLGATETEKESLINELRDANTRIRNHEVVKRIEASVTSGYSSVYGSAAADSYSLGISDPSYSSIVRSLALLVSNNSIDILELERNSDGFNNILYIAIILEYFAQRTRTDSAGQLLIIDEPEAHVHPALQRRLVDQLSRGSAQTVITSHSPTIASHLPISTIVSFSKDEKGEAHPQAIGSALRPDECAVLDRLLDSARSELLFSSKLLLVEGVAEYILLPTLLDSIGLNPHDSHISIVAIGGTHFDSITKLFASGALSQRCAIVRDGDRNRANGTLLPVNDDGTNISASDNEMVREFSNRTTFECTLLQRHTAPILTSVVTGLGFTRISPRIERLLAGGSDEDLARAQLLLLRVAERAGKGRFAQAVRDNWSPLSFCPQYVRDAVVWLNAAPGA